MIYFRLFTVAMTLALSVAAQAGGNLSEVRTGNIILDGNTVPFTLNIYTVPAGSPSAALLAEMLESSGYAELIINNRTINLEQEGNKDFNFFHGTLVPGSGGKKITIITLENFLKLTVNPGTIFDGLITMEEAKEGNMVALVEQKGNPKANKAQSLKVAIKPVACPF